MSAELEKVLADLEVIKKALASLLLAKELSNVQELLGTKPTSDEKPALSRAEALDELAKMCAVNTVDGKRVFTLSRATEDYEYEKSAKDGDWITDKNTEWVPKYVVAEKDQQSKNPVMSCYISEDSIESLPEAHGNSSTWGNLGENPFAHRYTVIVKPGTYKIYQELKS